MVGWRFVPGISKDDIILKPLLVINSLQILVSCQLENVTAKSNSSLLLSAMVFPVRNKIPADSTSVKVRLNLFSLPELSMWIMLRVFISSIKDIIASFFELMRRLKLFR